jgi:hypothetical protein
MKLFCAEIRQTSMRRNTAIMTAGPRIAPSHASPLPSSHDTRLLVHAPGSRAPRLALLYTCSRPHAPLSRPSHGRDQVKSYHLQHPAARTQQYKPALYKPGNVCCQDTKPLRTPAMKHPDFYSPSASCPIPHRTHALCVAILNPKCRPEKCRTAGNGRPATKPD